MGHGVKMLPELANGDVVFQFGGADTVDNSFFRKSVVVFIKDDGGNPLALVFGMYPYQIENNV